MRYATAIFLLLLGTACTKGPQLAPEVVAVGVRTVPALPSDPAWDAAPEHPAKLLPQDQVEPRLMAASTPEVRVRALTDGSTIAFRLEWADATKNDLPGPAKMIDGCAVQLPVRMEKDPPDPQMGQDGKPVQVTYWRADWQASVDGRGDTIRDLHPNASIDHYPAEAKPLDSDPAGRQEMALRYSPARALGNLRSGPRSVPVEELIATGPGTLSPGPAGGAKGKGRHGVGGWSVMVSRKLPEGLAVDERTHVAFAVWQGSHQETGARKMRSGWIPLVRRSGER